MSSWIESGSAAMTELSDALLGLQSAFTGMSAAVSEALND